MLVEPWIAGLSVIAFGVALFLFLLWITHRR